MQGISGQRTALGRVLAIRSLPLVLVVTSCASVGARPEIDEWRSRAARVTITRDEWGIAHVHGRSDADAVFGMIYAQAEDDFPRIERNYLVALGRLAEAEGERAIWQDLRAKLYMQPADLKARYAASPAWLKRLMNAWAAGLNFYLATHPEVKPRVITRFEPWMALSFTEGSISSNIERISLKGLEAFYSPEDPTVPAIEKKRVDEPSGSNGFAIAPSRTKDGKALLLINPHTSFFFRSEIQMTSDEGLNAYGAATWGQFFIYQGFNERAGWMNTTSGADVVDEFLELIVKRKDTLFYRYGTQERPIATVPVTVAYRAADGTLASRTFKTFRTHRGPIIREQDGKWVSFAMMHKPVAALQQSYLRTKVRDYSSFVKVADLKANSSNNTIFADTYGNIAYFHPQFIPVRDDRFDYSKPVDGSNPAADWKGLHRLSEIPRLLNPANGWIQNTNNWPYSAAGPFSPKALDYPRYMDVFGENPRGIHAIRVLSERADFTLEGLRDAAYSSYLPFFAQLLPGLIVAFDALPQSSPLRSRLAGPVGHLRGWDYRWGIGSVPTSLAVFWGEELLGELPRGVNPLRASELVDLMERQLTADQKLKALDEGIARLEKNFGTWNTAWGEINRFQRLTGDIVQPFSDAAPSIAVGFTSGNWGSLASFGARAAPGTRRYYGTTGNSFVAVVEFGGKVRARAVTAGGVSGDPKSPYFNNQAERYATGNLRDVHFYAADIAAHARRKYRPGQ
jgi:acyl-homoserine-lactone acylase